MQPRRRSSKGSKTSTKENLNKTSNPDRGPHTPFLGKKVIKKKIGLFEKSKSIKTPLDKTSPNDSRIHSFIPFEACEKDDSFIQIPEGKLPSILELANDNYQTLQRQGFLHFRTYESDIGRPSKEHLLSIVDQFANGVIEHNSKVEINLFETSAVLEYVYSIDKIGHTNRTTTFSQVQEEYDQYMKSKGLPEHVSTESYLDLLRKIAYGENTLKTYYTVLLGKLPLFQFTRNNFNIDSLENPLLLLPGNIPGITACYTYIGSMFSTFPAHEEDFSCNSISVNYGPGTKVWFILNMENSQKFENHMQQFAHHFCKTDKNGKVECSKWLQHKFVLTDPQLLRDANIRFTVVHQEPGHIIITGAACIHFGFNLSFNVATASNIILHDYALTIPAVVNQCTCEKGGSCQGSDILAKFIKIGRQDFRNKNPEIELEFDPDKDNPPPTIDEVTDRKKHELLSSAISSATFRENYQTTSSACATNTHTHDMNHRCEGLDDDCVNNTQNLISVVTGDASTALVYPQDRKLQEEELGCVESCVKRYKCILMNLKTNDTCHLRFRSYKELRRHHQTLMHQTKANLNQECKLCNKMFVNKFVLERHMITCQKT